MSPERKALFLTAPNHQGGHSEAGASIAQVLGVPFPVTMGDLVAKARTEGENPARLYRWLIKMARRADASAHDYFTEAEIAASQEGGE